MTDNKTALDLTIEDLARGMQFSFPQTENPNYTDILAARWFADTFSKCLCFNTTANNWYWYDGSVWQEDKNKVAEKAAENFARAFWLYVADKNEAFRKVANKLQQYNNRKHLLDDAKKHNAFPMEHFDAHPELLNCRCGTFNLNTMEWQEHDYRDYLTKVTNVTEALDHVEPAYYAEFQKFLLEIQPEERAAFLQQVFGLALTENIHEEKFFIIYGPTTRNGKSSLLDAIGNMMGSYCVAINPETLSASTNRSGSGPSPDRANMRGARLLHVSEFTKGTLFDAAFIKRITGGDPIRARHLHQGEFQFYLTGQIVINTNWLPAVNDVTIFDSGRAVVIPFEVQFSQEDQDLTLKDHLKSPGMANQVFYWALDGLKAYRKQGRLRLPESVQEAVESYRYDSDKVARFMQECTVQSEKAETAKRLYNAYMLWCNQNGYHYEGKKTFNDELRRKGLLSGTGTVDGTTCRNVVKGVVLEGDFAKQLDI